jgi:hypothetical protein
MAATWAATPMRLMISPAKASHGLLNALNSLAL